MKGVLRHRGFARLWAGELVSMIGDWLTYVAVGVLAIEQGGVWAVLGVLLAHTVPRALVAPLAGMIADRHDRRRVMAWGCVARGLSVVGMVVAAGAEAPFALQALLVLRMASGAFVDAAAGAAVPRLVPRAELARAHAVLGTTWGVVFAGGVALGGLATAAVGPVVVLAIDALTFFVAAGVFAGLPALCPRAPGPRASAFESWSSLWPLVRARPALARAVLAKAPVMIANGGAWVLLHWVSARHQGAAVPLTLGALHLVRALGTGLGPTLWARVSALAGTEAGLRSSTALVLLGVVWFASSTHWVGWVVGALLWGAGMGSHWATAATRLQGLGPDPVRGRLVAVDLVVHTAGQGLGGAMGTLGLGVLMVGGTLTVVGMTVPLALLAWAATEWGTRSMVRVSGRA